MAWLRRWWGLATTAPAAAAVAPAPSWPDLGTPGGPPRAAAPVAAGPRVSAAGTVPLEVVELVAAFEGFQPRAYLCPGRVWTIGYGTTRWADGRRVATGDGPIDEAAARRLLARDLADAAEAVDALVDVPLAEGERAALISFVHNLGRGAFSASTLLQKLNLGQRDGAAGEFARWNRGGGRVLPGLIRRRAAEAALFGGGDWRRVARVG